MGESRIPEAIMSGALFREIHKNAWLKRLPPDTKRSNVVTKKGDRVWIVFCVHDDSEAFLEGYTNAKIAASHSPDWFVCLNGALHISPSICPRQNEYEFVITLSHEIIRLTAPTWESMHDWVEVLRSKLREMRILSPNENMYSKMPEIKPILLPTRDPTSPLPAPPPVPAILVPGVEPIPVGLSNASNHSHINSLDQEQSSENNIFTYDDFALENIVTDSTSQCSTVPESPNETSTNISLIPDQPKSEGSLYLTKHVQPVISIDVEPCIANSELTKCNDKDKFDVSNVTILDTTDPNPVSFLVGCSSLVTIDTIGSSDANFKINHTQNFHSGQSKNSFHDSEENIQLSNKNITSLFVANSMKKNGLENHENSISMKTSCNNPEYDASSSNPLNIESSNVTIIQVPNSQLYNSDQNLIGLNQQSNQSEPLKKQLIVEENSGKSGENIVFLYNSNEIQSECHNEIVQEKTDINILNPSQIRNKNKISKLNLSRTINDEIGNGSKYIEKNVNNGYYEKIFLPSTSDSITNVPVNINLRIPPKSPKFSLLSKQQRSVSHTELRVNRDRIQYNFQSPLIENEATNSISINNPAIAMNSVSKSVPSTSAKRDETSGSGSHVKHILMRGMTELQIRSKNTSNHNNSPNVEIPNGISHSNPGRAIQANGEKRRRSLSSSEASRNDVSERNARDDINNTVVRACTGDLALCNSVRKLTLREQQVLQLRQEMNHPGGVRLTLRKKDCLGSIALVDALGLVWIAGWKQKQHPMLYNALHIGDHLMSVAGVPIKSASDVTKVIRGFIGQYVEFVVRRVPFGRVYAIRKETEGQCLGIIQDSNTATIVDIVPNSLAARHGIPPKAQTCDGLSLTSWVLTEINGRPLNLFFKDNEVRDRLNAVGRDISLLIQPLDLIKQLKKQLKCLRGYKDYIVQ